MRLHRLRMTALGPYATEQVIDFDRLAHGGLFLLEGPTGAGKSTVLDAVTFALYGGLAGADSADDRLRSHFAAPDARTEAELEWSLRGVRYRVTRSPEYRRPKKRGDGLTTEASRVHLQRRDGTAWASVSANKAEAGEMITELLGLTRGQFTQVMLLPQGEFARFLHSSDDVRRALLTRLFGTSLYDRITDGLCRLRTEATRTRERAGRAIELAVSAAAEAAGLDAVAGAELLEAPRADRHTCLKELQESLAQAVAVTGAEVEAAIAAVAGAAAQDEEARRQARLMARLTGALAELRAHEATRPEHDRRAGQLVAARHAEPVRPLLDALSEAAAAARAATGEITCLIAEPGEDALAGRGGQETAGRAAAAEAEAAALQRTVDAERGLPAAEAGLAGLDEAAAAAEEEVASLERARHDLPGRITVLETRLSEARVAGAGLEAAQQRLTVVDRQRQAAERLAGLAPLMAERAAAALAAVEAHQRAVDEHQQLVDARLTGMAAELAARLAEGRKCPVCGSAAHPEPAAACEPVVSADEVGRAAERREAAEAGRRQAEEEHAELAVAAAAEEALADGCDVASLAAEAARLAGEAAEAQGAREEAARLEAELADVRAEAEGVAVQLGAVAPAAAVAREQAGQARAALDRLRAELSEAARGHPSVAARQAALCRSAEADRALGRALDALAAYLADEARARERADGEALARGFASLEEAAAAALAPPEQASLADQVSAWERALAALTAAVQATDLAGLDPGRAEEAAARAKATAADLALALQTEREALAASQAAARKAERFAQRSGDVRAVEDDYDRVAEETEAVIHLAGLASGTEGQRRVALTTYVLRHWFGQVVAAANVRLSAMSSGRYELRRTDEGKARRDRSGLTLAVIDRHTGEERSPASLSGGETFYTSLALALGLADVVRAEAGGVDLDTLFIDEGFGSLDSGTLDQVMGVIDDLRERGRVIGIVSHLAELKERVPERLEVRHLPDGSSAVRVVA
jgi:DNA repair protein SbcC/Rad50